MDKYIGFEKLLVDYKQLPTGMIYSVEKKENDLMNAIFYVVTSNETKELKFIEGDLGEVPADIYDDKYIVCELFETEIFRAIIDLRNKKEKKPIAEKDAKFFLEALEYYLENDDFLE